MSPVDWIVVLVALQRVSELAYANHNQKRLLAEGGVEHGAGHYPLFVVLHSAWLVAIWVLADPARPIEPVFLGVFLALQGMRVWIVVTLGRFWTTRIISVPGIPLVQPRPLQIDAPPQLRGRHSRNRCPTARVRTVAAGAGFFGPERSLAGPSHKNRRRSTKTATRSRFV